MPFDEPGMREAARQIRNGAIRSVAVADMTERQAKSGPIDAKALLGVDDEFLRTLVRTTIQEVLEAEMTKALGRRRGSGRRAGWAIGRVIMAGR